MAAYRIFKTIFIGFIFASEWESASYLFSQTYRKKCASCVRYRMMSELNRGLINSTEKWILCLVKLQWDSRLLGFERYKEKTCNAVWQHICSVILLVLRLWVQKGTVWRSVWIIKTFPSTCLNIRNTNKSLQVEQCVPVELHFQLFGNSAFFVTHAAEWYL